MKTWPALSVRFSTGDPAAETLARDRLAAALDDARATAVQELDDRWVVFFATAAERDRALALLGDAGGGIARVETLDVPDENWARRSQRELTPIRVGRIVVTPPWAAEAGPEPAADDGAEGARQVTIVIQPSMGFGTGHHATTRLCLGLMQRIDLSGRTVLDVGTGSGVLALAARALGARAVAAVDDDPDAIESARENLGLNGVTEGIDLHLGDFRGMPQGGAGWDVVTANLTGGLLARGAEALTGAVAPGGTLIVSGVTLDEEADVVAAFAPRMTPVARVAEDEWVGVVLQPCSSQIPPGALQRRDADKRRGVRPERPTAEGQRHAPGFSGHRHLRLRPPSLRPDDEERRARDRIRPNGADAGRRE
jgi:ribosomal protein L11 methyltransferase